MNSALQCLSNAGILTKYFLRGEHKKEINTKNLMGSGGKLATCYANLLKELWSGTSESVRPKTLKSLISKYAPQFGGYAQHDSQELLGYLLDGIHEDLNRVEEKKYVESVEKELEGVEEEEERSEKCWQLHLSRNQSIILDLFQGQLKSRLVCATKGCSNVSVMFDPFLFLSLPLPSSSSLLSYVELSHCFLSPQLPIKYSVRVDNKSSLLQLYLLLKPLLPPPPPLPLGDSPTALEASPALSPLHFTEGRVVFCDVWCHRVYDQRKPTSKVSAIQKEDHTFAHPAPDKSYRHLYLQVNLVHRKKDIPSSSYEERGGGRGSKESFKLLGLPLILFVLLNSSSKDLYHFVWHKLSCYIKKEKCEEEGNAPLFSSFSSKKRPFILKFVNNVNPSTTCGICEKENCTGCKINYEDTPIRDLLSPTNSDSSSKDKKERKKGKPNEEERKKSKSNEEESKRNSSNTSKQQIVCVAVEWTNEGFEEYFESNRNLSVRLHPSVKENRNVSLAACMDLFSTEEELSENDTWFCPKCKKHTRARKKMDVWNCSEILVIHLKRFSATRYGGRDKVTSEVTFPINSLDMSKYIHSKKHLNSQNHIYNLFAVINHSGSLGGGHYTAYCKSPLNKQWYNFNDSYVSPIEESKIVSSQAYVLFYERAHDNSQSSSSEDKKDNK